MKTKRAAATCCGRFVCGPIVPAALFVVMFAGCSEPVDIPPMDVKVVDAYGVRLDELATPQQVTYVLLRSLRDDVLAAQSGDRERQKEAFRITFSLAAYSDIEKRLLSMTDQSDRNKASTRRIHDVINHWAPIVGHYVRSFDLDEKTAVSRMRTLNMPDNSAVILYEVVHDPKSSDPADRKPVILEVTLVREKATEGSQEYVRVARGDFRGLAHRPATTGPAATQPATSQPVGG